MISDAAIKALVDRIVVRVQPQRVIVFGSHAKGRAHGASDLDLFVVLDTQLPYSHRSALLAPIMASTLLPVDLHIHTPEEVDEYGSDPFSFIANVVSTGRTVYDARSTVEIPRVDGHLS